VSKPIGISALLLAFAVIATAQQPAKPTAKAAPRPEARAEAAAPTQLPVTRVSLYKNGVGFFEHSGRVTGNQSVNIDFTTAQLNDVLQSLTAVDLNGGRIAGAGYNSTTPLEEQLKALPLALGEDPTAVDFYNAIRGARVEVRSGTATVSGRLLNIEVVNSPETNNQPACEKRLITVIGDAGPDSGTVRTLELTPATSVRLLDADLHTDVTRYLQLLASTRNQGLRHLTLQDNGTGTRELHVSYISEVPIWKSTYRILFTDPASPTAATKQTATVQGWSVVDNTTGADWINVQLSLIAGAPQSFIQPLSVPYYSRRPEIGLPQEAQLTPQTHESGEETKTAPTAAPMQGKTLGSGNGAGLGGTIENQLYSQVPLSMNGAPRDSTSFQYLMPGIQGNGGAYGGTGAANLNQNYVEGMPVSAIASSFAANTETSTFDDYFAYNLAEPITIRKNESAMVPILQTSLPAESVTLVSYANARVSQPLRALWLTNSSTLTLDRGSFAILENGNFAGEGLLDPIHPDEKRLLSYAADQALHVSTGGENLTNHVTSVTAAKGVLRLHRTDIHEVTLVPRNAAPTRRTVVSEFPVVQGWQLDSDPTPAETTPTLYRFRTLVDPGQTVRLHVGARRQGTTEYALTQSNDATLTYILSQSGNNTALQAALQPILEARRHVADMQTAVDKVNNHLKDLRSDEERQRSNITALATADKNSRERFVRDLNATEDQIAAAQKDLTTAQATLQTAKDSLASKIESLQIDETL